MVQSRTHTCNDLRLEHAGEQVKLVGWMENVREVGHVSYTHLTLPTILLV